MTKFLYRILWMLVVGVPIIEAINSYWNVFWVDKLFYRGIFYLGILVITYFVTPFLIDFFIFKKHIYNRILGTFILNTLFLWFLNDYMPHFELLDFKIIKLVLFSLVISIWLQVAYKISRKI